MSKEKKILKRAAAIVDKGWCQWGLFQYSGGLVSSSLYPRDEGGEQIVGACALGAIYLAAAEMDVAGTRGAKGAMNRAIHRATVAVGEPLHLWNDDPLRTKNEVVYALGTTATRRLGFVGYLLNRFTARGYS